MITGPAIYFWSEGEVKVKHWGGPADVFIHDVPCVDTGENVATLRYGAFTGKGWKPIPLEDFPKEFRLQLLLLGIS